MSWNVGRVRRVAAWVTIFTLAGVAPVLHPIHIQKSKAETVLPSAEQRKANRELAKKYAWVGFGWRGNDWECVDYIFSAESSYNHLADNPESSAFGIGQMLGERSDRADVQILRSLAYIADRYGTPCKAMKHHIRHNYY